MLASLLKQSAPWTEKNDTASSLAGKRLPVSDTGPVCKRPRAAELEPGSASVNAPRLAWCFQGFQNYKGKSAVQKAALLGMHNLQQYAKQGEELRSLPWRAFIDKLFSQWHGDSIVDAIKASRLCAKKGAGVRATSLHGKVHKSWCTSCCSKRK